MMEHYSEFQWELFIKGEMDEVLYEEMLQHSLECEACLNIYLELLEKDHTEDMIPDGDFRDKVMMSISVENNLIRVKNQKRNRANLIIYYTSAASITLFLFWSGVFQGVLGSLPQSEKHIDKTKAVATGIFVSGWTEKLSDSTANLINNIDSGR